MFLQIRELIAKAVCPEVFNERRALSRAANIDALTELGNRRAFMLAETTATRDASTWFISFDVNRFKLVNDTFGHPAGDELLKEVASAIYTAAETFGFGQRVFRLGGDEFAIICPANLAEQIRDLAELNFGKKQFEGFAVSISGTFGETFFAADEILQRRKKEQKENVGNF